MYTSIPATQGRCEKCNLINSPAKAHKLKRKVNMLHGEGERPREVIHLKADMCPHFLLYEEQVCMRGGSNKSGAVKAAR